MGRKVIRTLLLYREHSKVCRCKGAMISGKIITRSIILLLALITALLVLIKVTIAVRETPYDLISAVNDLRALNGLEPYQIDPWLMDYAQEHSEYMAAMQTGTHLRNDGTLPWQIGIQENVASGDEGIVTISVVVYEIWVDWGHRHVLTGYGSGEIGAGMARADNGQIYYTVDVRPAKGAPTVIPNQGTPVPFVPYLTSTPDADGSILHVVGYGQSLWSIAISYGVTVNDLRCLNGIAGDSTVIQVGQKLLVRPASAVTPALAEETSSITPIPVTDTPIPFTKTIAPTETVIPSLTSTIVPTNTAADLSLNGVRISGEVALLIAVIGFVIVLYFGFGRSKDE
jgi:hypothetical protein